MRFFSKYHYLSILAISFFINVPVSAAVDEYCGVSSGTDIPLGDTVICTFLGSITGTLNNYGELVLNQPNNTNVSGILNNYGLIKNEYEFTALNNSNIINHPNAVFNNTEWLTLNTGSTLDNFGTINFIPNVGDGPKDNRFRLYGTFNNNNICLFDDPNIDVAGEDILNDGSGGNFINKGSVNISSRTGFSTNISYTQDAGETIIDGVFSAANIRVNAGIIRGNGTLTATNTLMLGRGAGFSPGSTTSPLDTLTINVDGGMLISVFNYVNIELGSNSQQHDKLQVNGDLYLFGTINVSAQDVPSTSQSFEIISSDSPITFGQSLKINLPGFLNWDIEYTDTSIIIHRI